MPRPSGRAVGGHDGRRADPHRRGGGPGRRRGGDLAGSPPPPSCGVDFVQIPTTLLAQVDSSVGQGGRGSGAREESGGAFWQPRLVLMDPEVLDTLPLPVFMEGMAEVVKYGCIRDAAFSTSWRALPGGADGGNGTHPVYLLRD